MKKIIFTILLATTLVTTAQENPNNGFLPSRVSTAVRDAFVNPAKGLVIFNTTTNGLQLNTGTGPAPIWSPLPTGISPLSSACHTFHCGGGGQSIPAATAIILDDSSLYINRSNSYSSSTNQFVAQEAGDYYFYGQANTNPSDASYVGCNFYKNGVAYTGGTLSMSTPSVYGGSSSSSTISLAIGDIVTFRFYYSGGVAAAMVNSFNWGGYLLGCNINSTVTTEPWFNQATGTGATANTQNVYQMGNVGIGTTAPTAKLEVNGSVKFTAAGTPAAGRVLTSDASGNATWVDNVDNTLSFANINDNVNALAVGTIVHAAGGDYNFASQTLPKGVYYWQIYNCASQLTYSNPALVGTVLQWVGGTATVISTNTYLNIQTEPNGCATVYSGIVKVTTAGTANLRLSSYLNSQLVKSGATALSYTLIKIN